MFVINYAEVKHNHHHHCVQGGIQSYQFANSVIVRIAVIVRVTGAHLSW